MTIKVPSTSEYQYTLYKTLPKGVIWPPATEESNVKTLSDSIAYNTRLVAVEAVNMLTSSFPSASAYIEDWERVFDLPKESLSASYFTATSGQAGDSLGTIYVTAELPTDINVRVAQVLSFFQNTGLNNDAFYESLAQIFGLTITITTTSAFEVSINILTGTDEGKTYFTQLANFFRPVYVRLTIT